MKKTAIVALSLLTITAAAKSDFSACKEYLQPSVGAKSNTNPFFGGFNRTGPFFENPFIVKDDGSLEAKEGVNVRRNEDGTKEVFMTKEAYVKFDAKKSFGEREIEQRPVDYIVTRNEKGEILSIKRAMAYTESDRKDLIAAQNERIAENIQRKYEGFVKQEGRELTAEEKSFMKDEIERTTKAARLGLPTGNTVNFEHRNGKCLAVSNVGNSTIAQDKEAEEINTTMMDTALCRDISQFLKQNPEAKACFRKDLNSRMERVFAKHAEKFTKELSKSFGIGSPLMLSGMGLGFGGGIGGYGLGGMGMGGFGMSLGQKVLMSQPDNQAEFLMQRKDISAEEKAKLMIQWQEGKKKSNILYGSSPVIRGQQLLEGCLNQGVEAFINDDELWKEQAVSRDSIDATKVELK